MIITPGILSGSFEEVVHILFLLEGLTEWVQIDVCDGVFGLEKTWLPYKEKELPHGFSYEFDLMVNDWRRYLNRAIELGAKRVVMHVDTFTLSDIDEMVSMAKKHHIYIGISTSNNVPVEDFIDKIHSIEERYPKIYIQVMGIRKIGAQGQPFDESVLRRISYIHDACRNIEIQVDGAMTPETISKVRERGASYAVVGSYIFGNNADGEDIKKNLEQLRENY